MEIMDQLKMNNHIRSFLIEMSNHNNPYTMIIYYDKNMKKVSQFQRKNTHSPLDHFINVEVGGSAVLLQKLAEFLIYTFLYLYYNFF